MKKPNEKQLFYHLSQIYYGYFRNEGFNHEAALEYSQKAAIDMMENFFPEWRKEPQ